MALPGKLCVGILEEDNPLKSYFRFKPLLVAEGDNYVVYSTENEFPEDGCIRIVPDKNESSRFKARMRRAGKFCIVDLREHPEENDKIRSNKNYRGDDSEANAYIIYSDVIREAPEGMIAEIVSGEPAEDTAQIAMNIPSPCTARVIMGSGRQLWKHSPIEGVPGGMSLERDGDKVAPADAQIFEVAGFAGEQMKFAIAKPGALIYEMPAVPGIVVHEEAPAPEPPARVVPEKPVATPEQPKPWIHHDASMLPKPVDPSLSPWEKALALQSGINPRRGRNLQEIIDEKWRHSRFDQLGQPVPEAVTRRPITTPVDNAVEALREAWDHVQARPCIANAICRIDGFADAVFQSAGEIANNRHIEMKRGFEAEKEQLVREIESFREENDRLRREMSASLKADMQTELDNHKKRVDELTKMEKAISARTEAARRTAEAAREEIAQLTDETLNTRISQFMVDSRAADIIGGIRGGVATVYPAQGKDMRVTDRTSARDLSARIVNYFAGAGFTITADEATNLLAGFTLFDHMLISGPAGCGKSAYAALLTKALGLKDAGCVLEYKKGAAYADVPPELARVIVAEDVNIQEGIQEDILGNVPACGDTRIVMTCQDSASGKPLDPRLLDRAMFIRIEEQPASAVWCAPASGKTDVEDVITVEALRRLYPKGAACISPQVKQAMADIRAQLERYNVRISRRALSDIWTYCAAVTHYMEMSPIEVFDLAFSQRALPMLLATAPVRVLHALPKILAGMPRCLKLLSQPIAIEI